MNVNSCNNGKKVCVVVAQIDESAEPSHTSSVVIFDISLRIGCLRDIVVEHWSLTGELSLSCSQTAALMWMNRLL